MHLIFTKSARENIAFYFIGFSHLRNRNGIPFEDSKYFSGFEGRTSE